MIRSGSEAVRLRDGAALHVAHRKGERLTFSVATLDGKELCSWQPPIVFLNKKIPYPIRDSLSESRSPAGVTRGVARVYRCISLANLLAWRFGTHTRTGGGSSGWTVCQHGFARRLPLISFCAIRIPPPEYALSKRTGMRYRSILWMWRSGCSPHHQTAKIWKSRSGGDSGGT